MVVVRLLFARFAHVIRFAVISRFAGLILNYHRITTRYAK